MANDVPQNLKNHARFVPAYHFVAFFIVGVNVLWTIYKLVRPPFMWGEVMAFFLAIAIGIIYWYIRVFALTVQDRIIRLEMRLRLQQLLPDDLKKHIGEFSVGQLVALRFAGDAELPALARKVIEGDIKDRKAIKAMITDWQGDYLRA